MPFGIRSESRGRRPLACNSDSRARRLL